MRQGPRLRRLAVGLGLTFVLAGCGASEAGETSSEPAAESASASPSTAVTIPGDGTYLVGDEVQPGVYVGAGGEECRYHRLGDMDAGYDDVIVRGFLDRPVIEIMADDGGFRTQGCGWWVLLDDYSASPTTEMPGDGIWLVGEDVVPGTYRAEGGEWCLWQRLDAFAPELDSVITGGSDKRVTIEEGDLAFVTEGCGAWTKTE